MAELSVLGLPRLYTYRCYYRPLLRRWKWSPRRFEAWLEKHELTVLFDDVDELGDYYVVGTYDGELAQSIENMLSA